MRCYWYAGQLVPLFVLLQFILSGCRVDDSIQLGGLWQLEKVNIDGHDRPVSRTFVKFQPDGSFAVSELGGDFLGTYALKGSTAKFSSATTSWFNTDWTYFHFEDQLDLRGTELGYRNTNLVFRKIGAIPLFDDFEKKLIGEWELYRVFENHEIADTTPTKINFLEDGRYAIASPDSLLENGFYSVDTRHQKVAFEHHETAWRAWFYGQELRLSNDAMELRYALRR